MATYMGRLAQTVEDNRVLLAPLMYPSVSGTDGRVVDTDGGALLNFASCSYLGLETHPDLVDAAVDAATRWGTQLSSSRMYAQSSIYEQAEHDASEVMGHPTLLFPSTTLAHQNLPRGLSPSGDRGIGGTSCVRHARYLCRLT